MTTCARWGETPPYGRALAAYCAANSGLGAAARALFLDKGYAATSTPEVVEAAGLTRGALYHHFRDKQALFAAVVEAEAQAVAGEIEAGSGGAKTPRAALLAGARAYFRAMRAPGRVRLLLLDGPAVLGNAAMRQIDLRSGDGTLRQGLAEALGPGHSAAGIEALADLVSAMFDRAALACAEGGKGAVHESVLERALARLT